MPLPFFGNKSQNQTSQDPGATPMGQTPTTPRTSTFSVMAKQLGQDFNQQFAITPGIQRGLYGAFGNNAITRTAAGAVGSLGDAFDSLINGPRKPEDDLTEEGKILQKQLKALEGLQTSLDSLAKESSQKSSEGSSTLLEGLTKVITDQSEKLGKGLEELKLEFSGFHKAMGDTGHGTGGILGDMEVVPEKVTLESREHEDHRDQLQFKPSTDLKPNEVPKGQVQVLNQLKDAKSFLKNIAFTTSKILEALSPKDQKVKREVENKDDIGPHDLGGKGADVKGKAGTIEEAENDNSPGILGGLMSGMTGLGSLARRGVKNMASKALHFMTNAGEKIGEKFGAIKEGAVELGEKALEGGKNFVEKLKVPSFITEAAEKLSPKALGGSLLKFGKGALKAIPGLGALVTGATTAYDAYEAGSNAEDVLDIKDRKATFGEKIEAGLGGAAESLSFGLLDKKKSAKWIDNLFSSKPDEQKMKVNEVTPKPAEPAAGQPAPAAPVNVTAKSETNNYVSSRRLARNNDESFNRYLDKTYTF